VLYRGRAKPSPGNREHGAFRNSGIWQIGGKPTRGVINSDNQRCCAQAGAQEKNYEAKQSHDYDVHLYTAWK
jgi:hypothetical protein